MTQHSSDKQPKKHSRRRILIAVLALLLLAAGGIGGTLLAKYVSENRQQAEMISAGFHISSDYLKENGPTHNVGTAGNLVIDLYNYEVENTAQRSAVAMQYTVTVTGGTLLNITSDGVLITASAGRYTFAVNDTNKSHVLTVAPSAEDVTVTVSTVSPYEKTLSATFHRNVTAGEPSYTLTQHTSPDVWKLTIFTNGYNGNISITCNIAPDNTNDIMATWRTGNTYSFSVQDNETYELLFFGSAQESNGTGHQITVGAGH